MQVESFSKQEIVKKLNEIKYLTTQKRIPKLTLRKEILHLESKLKKILQLEKRIAKEEKKDSTKVKALKAEVETLKNKLNAAEDKDLAKKVQKAMMEGPLSTGSNKGDMPAKRASARELSVEAVKKEELDVGTAAFGKTNLNNIIS